MWGVFFFVIFYLFIFSFSSNFFFLQTLELERLAKRQQQMGKRPRKQVVVRRNFQGGKGAKGGKGKTKCVDRRLLKDTRSVKAKEKREGGRKRKRK